MAGSIRVACTDFNLNRIPAGQNVRAIEAASTQEKTLWVKIIRMGDRT
jgi:hypothetical protein